MDERRRQQRYDARFEEIVDAAANLIARKGFAETSVAEICDHVGLGKGGLYYYIDSKDDLFLAIQERSLGPLIEQSRRIAEVEVDATIRLRMLSEFFLAVQFHRLDHAWVVLHDHRILHDDDRAREFRARRKEYEEILSRVLEEGLEDGSLAFDDLSMTKLAFLGMHNYTYQWLNPSGRLDARGISRAYCRIFLAGIAGRPIDWPELDSAAVQHWDELALSSVF